jgi:hypothetical protein
MPIPFPRSAFPAMLEERGPREDPSILLTGPAEIGGASARIIAIRVSRSLRWTPDYKNAVPAESYRRARLDASLETFLENVEDLAVELSDELGDYVPSIMHLDAGFYMMWILPLRPDAEDRRE